jgi:hypothetical protein
MDHVKHLTLEELEAGLERVRLAPKDNGTLELIVRRPQVDGREILQTGELDPVEGLVGDNWKARGSSKTPDGSALSDSQITIMNARAIALLALTKERWPLAGDQLYVDLDLSADNLPPWTRLSLGSAVLEVTAQPHTGCIKFAARFGKEALKFVNSPAGKQLHLRGINTRIVQPGSIGVGDTIKKL